MDWSLMVFILGMIEIGIYINCESFEKYNKEIAK